MPFLVLEKWKNVVDKKKLFGVFLTDFRKPLIAFFVNWKCHDRYLNKKINRLFVRFNK